MIRRQQKSTLYPYTTLFRSRRRTRYFLHGEPEPLELRETNLSGVNLWEANLSRANLWKADLSRAILDRKSTRLNSSHANISYAVFCLNKKIYFMYALINFSK